MEIRVPADRAIDLSALPEGQEFLIAKSEWFDDSIVEIRKLKPFHEAILADIKGASEENLRGIASLFSRCVVPANHRAIAEAFVKRAKELGLPDDLGVTRLLFQQKEWIEAETKKKGAEADKAAELERLRRIESTLRDVLPAIGIMAERAPKSVTEIMDVFMKTDPDGPVGDTARRVSQITSSGDKTTE